MSSILRQIYDDLLNGNFSFTMQLSIDPQEIEETEMESLSSDHEEVEPTSWPDLSPEEKKKCILKYMKRNKIKGDISLYTFKEIRFNKEERKITRLTYYRKGEQLKKSIKM